MTFLIFFALIPLTAFINPGRCLVEQVDVNAPGSPNKIHFSSLITSLIDTSLGLVSKIKTLASGSWSPSFIFL